MMLFHGLSASVLDAQSCEIHPSGHRPVRTQAAEVTRRCASESEQLDTYF